MSKHSPPTNLEFNYPTDWPPTHQPTSRLAGRPAGHTQIVIHTVLVHANIAHCPLATLSGERRVPQHRGEPPPAGVPRPPGAGAVVDADPDPAAGTAAGTAAVAGAKDATGAAADRPPVSVRPAEAWAARLTLTLGSRRACNGDKGWHDHVTISQTDRLRQTYMRA